jgi:hypothetical protein
MKKEQRRPDIPTAFDQLGEEFFSLGQDDSKRVACTHGLVVRGGVKMISS